MAMGSTVRDTGRSHPCKSIHCVAHGVFIDDLGFVVWASSAVATPDSRLISINRFEITGHSADAVNLVTHYLRRMLSQQSSESLLTW